MPKQSWMIMSVALLLTLLLAGCVAVQRLAAPAASVEPTAIQAAQEESTPVGPLLRVDDVWSQPAVVMDMDMAAEPTPCPPEEVDDIGDSLASSTDDEPCAAEADAQMGADVDAMPTEDHTMDMEGTGARGVVYLTLINEGDEADRVIAIHTDASAVAEIHRTTMDDKGMMRMRPVEGGLEVPAQGEVKLEPASYHIMLIDLTQTLKVGDRFLVTLEFEKSGAMTVESEVRLP